MVSFSCGVLPGDRIVNSDRNAVDDGSWSPPNHPVSQMGRAIELSLRHRPRCADKTFPTFSPIVVATSRGYGYACVLDARSPTAM